VPAHVSGATHFGVHVYTLLGSCAGASVTTGASGLGGGCTGDLVVGVVGVLGGVLGTPRCIAKHGAFWLLPMSHSFLEALIALVQHLLSLPGKRLSQSVPPHTPHLLHSEQCSVHCSTH
jgi:uncharacterized membrane protein